MRIRKAVFPVAGLGTRFLPATKANPKEMLPIVDKPLIQYAVEEALAAGIEECIFVTNANKRAIEDHFDRNIELEHYLQSRGQEAQLKVLQNIMPDNVTWCYVRQSEPKGLGHAILTAAPLVGDEPFAVLLADDFIMNDGVPCLEQMVAHFANTNRSLVAVEPVAPQATQQYGVISFQDAPNPATTIDGIVEKPAPDVAPSHYGVVGRYVLTPTIFNHLQHTKPGLKGEIQLTDAIATLLNEEAIDALHFAGKRFDCGNKLGYVQATLAVAMTHPEIRESLDKKTASDLYAT